VRFILAGTVTAGLAWLVGMQVVDLASRLPDYRENLRVKAHELRMTSEGPFTRLGTTIEELKQELSTTQPTTQTALGPLPIGPPAPVKVQLVEQPPDVTQIATWVAGPLVYPLAQAAITIVLLIFLLLYSDDLLARLVSLAGMRRISLTASATSEIALRVSSYLRAQLLVNLSYGAMIGIGLACFGIPNALLWGVLAFIVRFIPYLGPWLAAVLPTLLTIAVFPGWARATGVVVLFIVVELTTNLVLEPWIYGTSSGISSLGVVLATVFWAWMWGPVGLIVAVPVTVCLVVTGKYVPQLAVLHDLLGADKEIPLPLRLYQHLLAGDADAADELVTEASAETPPPELCDALLLPVLSELKRDLANRVVEQPQAQRVTEMLEMIIPEMPPADANGKPPHVMCLPGLNVVDQCATRLLAWACASRAVLAQALPVDLLANEAAEQTQRSGASIAVVVQVHPVSHLHSRRLIVALRARLDSKVEIIDLTAELEPGPSPETTDDDDLRREYSFVRVVSQLAETTSVDRDEPTPASS
jgi:predicted PurR-regulated permease PerM